MADHAAPQGQFRKKVIASGVVLAAGAALLSGGIYAGWTSGGTVDQGVGAVDLSAGFVETGGSDRLFDDIANAFPGDHWTRYATLANNGSVDQEFTVRADTEGGALTAENDGLRAAVWTCAVQFDANGLCEVGDTMPNPDTEVGGVVPNPDPDEVQVLADSFITPGGVDGTNVTVGDAEQLFFKIRYQLDPNANQATFQGKQDTALVEVASVTAQRPGTDRTNG